MSLRILVVDDEPMLADTLALILGRSGYHATAVYSCEAAIPIIESTNPLFVISDVVMPGMNGVALAMLIRSTYPGCKVLLFSGNADTQDLLELARAQGHDLEVMAKPVSPPKLLARVASLIHAHSAAA